MNVSNQPIVYLTYIILYTNYVSRCFLERFIYVLVYLFLAVLGLYSCWWAFSSHSRWGLHITVVLQLLIAVTSLHREARALGRQASVAMARRLGCSATCGIFLHQGLNLCPLH